MTAAGKATAVIAAAGSGERLGAGAPKALVEIAGRPILGWCLDAFADAHSVEAIVVAAPVAHEDAVEKLLPEGLAAEVVRGGPTRAESVQAAMAAVDGDVVAIHDAARPLVTAGLIDELVEALAARPEAAGVIAATPLTDTVKRAMEPRPADGPPSGGAAEVARTESRDHLWAAQTPQVFRADVLRAALAAGPDRIAAATDEATLVEEAGGTVLIHPSPAANLKVTTPHDLEVVGLLLAMRP